MVYLKRKGRCVTDTGDAVANEDIFLLGRTALVNREREIFMEGCNLNQ